MTDPTKRISMDLNNKKRKGGVALASLQVRSSGERSAADTWKPTKWRAVIILQWRLGGF